MASKLLTRPGYSVTSAQGDQFDNTRWTQKVSNSLAAFGLSYVATLGEDTPCEYYTEPPPWTENRTVFSCKLPNVYRDNVAGRRIHGEIQIVRLTHEDSATYYTDGTVDPDTGRIGAAFVYNGEEHLWRLSDQCSSLQTELAAVQQATSHATRQTNATTTVHEDSKAAIEVKTCRLKDNIHLTTTVLRNIRELQQQEKTVFSNGS